MNTRSWRTALALAAGVAATPALAQQQPPRPLPPQPGMPPQQPLPPQPAEAPIGRQLFPPELVMQHQREIGLTPAQRTGITMAIQRLQSRVVELQWTMQEQSQNLVDLLARPSVDSTAALAQVDRVLGVEREVKRAHLATLIQIKNLLSPEQQERLNALR